MELLLMCKVWVRISIRARCTTLCDKVCQWLATGRWFSPGGPVSFKNKTDRQDTMSSACVLYLAVIHRWQSLRRPLLTVISSIHSEKKKDIELLLIPCVMHVYWIYRSSTSDNICDPSLTVISSIIKKQKWRSWAC